MEKEKIINQMGVEGETKKKYSRNKNYLLDDVSWFSLNSTAETIVNIVAVVILVVFIILAVVSLLGGVAITQRLEFLGEFQGAPLIAFISALLVLMIGLFFWAILKLLVNISRSLFNISMSINGYRTLEKKEEQEREDEKLIKKI